MDNTIITVVAGVAAIVLVIMVFVKLLKNISPMSEQESIQHDVNKYSDGPGCRKDDQGKGGGTKAMLWAIIIVIILGLLLAYRSGDLSFHI